MRCGHQNSPKNTCTPECTLRNEDGWLLSNELICPFSFYISCFFSNIFKYIYFSGLTHSNFECRTLEKHWMNTNLIMKQKASDVFQRKKKVKWIARNSSSWKKQIMMMGKQIWWLFQCFHIELFALRKNNISRLKWQVNTSINLFCLLWRPYIFLKSYGWPETILFIRMFEIRSKVKV